MEEEVLIQYLHVGRGWEEEVVGSNSIYWAILEVIFGNSLPWKQNTELGRPGGSVR